MACRYVRRSDVGASVLSMELMSAPELDRVLADLRRHLSQPETLTISYAMIQVTGRVPGP